MMRVGVHWPEAGRRYPDGTPFVELVYLEGVASDDPHHLRQAVPRIEALAARHPGSEVLLRVDWRQGQAYARTDAERTAYRAALGELSRLRHLGGRLILQPGNEPQLEGARGWLLVEDALRDFIAQCHAGAAWRAAGERSGGDVPPQPIGRQGRAIAGRLALGGS